MKATFTRRSPAYFASKVGIPAGWFVVSWVWMPDKAQRRRAHGHWYKIKSENGEVLRILRFSGRLKADSARSEGAIVIDWPAWLKLHGYADDANKKPLILEIERASLWRFWALANAHPDPTYRLAAKLGLASVALGLLSLVLGALALFK
jgi:hypothetical protein